MSYSKRVKKSIESYLIKNTPELRPQRAPRINKNDKPEKAFVKQILFYLRSKGWSLDVVDSTAVYSKEAGRYLNSMARVGISDIVGNMPNGRSVYIEAKAPGRRRTIRPDQLEFLIGKIKTNAFAVVSDSIEHFDKIYNEWAAIAGAIERQECLLKDLPALAKKWVDSEDPLF